MKAVVRFKEASQPATFENAFNTYQKGDMFCISFIENGLKMVKKYPVANIFDVTETYD